MTHAVGVILPNIDLNRLPGDAGHPDSYGYPVLFEIAEEVTDARQMVNGELSPAVSDSYLKAALKLQEAGAGVITTTCGFLSVIQKRIAPELKVPFVASSLLQIPLVYALTRERICVITADDSVLADVHLDAAGAGAIPLTISGLQEFEAFSAPILENRGEVDFDGVRHAMETVALDSIRRHSDIGAFVFECHNLGSWAAPVRRATQRPVFDIISFIKMAAGSALAQ